MYGFLTAEDGKDIFVHFSAITAEQGKYRSLTENEEVEFEITETPKGKSAVNVKKVGAQVESPVTETK